MKTSPHFTPVDLTHVFNEKKEVLPDELSSQSFMRNMFGSASFRGIPFALGPATEKNVVYLDSDPVLLPLNKINATYLVFLHVVENRATTYRDDIPGIPFDQFSHLEGTESGNHVSDYLIRYTDGQTHTKQIRRRFSIQQAAISWGSSGFACVPAKREQVVRSHGESVALGELPVAQYGKGETRHQSGRDYVRHSGGQQGVWLYALPNPHPEREIQSVLFHPRNERSAIYGITSTNLRDHPLRYPARHKLILTIPENVSFNAIGELDEIDIDLGNIISARRRQLYEPDAWNINQTDVQPSASQHEVIVEYAAHPAAELHVRTTDGPTLTYPVGSPSPEIQPIPPAHRPVTITIIDKKSRHPVGVRLHIHGQAGEYLPPKGYHRKVNDRWFEDNYGEFINGGNQYAFIRGECIADLPLGTVYIEITRGYEVTPIRQAVEIDANTNELTFELDRVLDWHSRGWVTADTHVHFLTPTTAVLEGEAEDVNVVNLLASQWGEMFSNTTDFDGATTHTNTLAGNNGNFLCRVGSENRMQTLGHISLLGYSGELIHPLCTGGPSESALGDFQEVTMADWAQRCLDQNGLVVMPHAPNPQLERVADVVLDVVNAIEIMSFNPYKIQLEPSAVADWYRFLNTGYNLPITGGSDKMNAASLVGGIRTYTQLGEREFTYENWMEATRSGHTFVTVGPLVDMLVEGSPPGSKIRVGRTGGTVTVVWEVESVRLPINAVEIVLGGKTISEEKFNRVMRAKGSCELTITDSSWIAVRVRGNYNDVEPQAIAAHTSAVQVLCGDKPVYRHEDAVEMLKQIEGAIAYVDTVASRPDADRYRKLKMTLETSYNRLHQRMHQQGHYHEHSPIHNHGHEH